MVTGQRVSLFRIMKTLVYFFLGAICVSCNFIDDEYSVIPPDSKLIVDQFFKIAHEKGVRVDPMALKIYYVNGGLEGFVAGKATISKEIINIDTTSTAWIVNPESVLFHELGHIYLHRGHDDASIDGHAKSIMNTYGVSYWPKIRQYYIDELFNPNTKAPEKPSDWY